MHAIIGKCLGVTRTPRTTNDGRAFEQTSIHVLDGVHTVKVDCVKDFRSELPEAGQVVVLEVGVRAFSGRSGGALYSVSGFARVPEMEQALLKVVTAA